MYKYEKSFSERGVMANLRAWETAKAPLLTLLRKHPAWQEEEKAVVIELSEGRGIERDVVDEVSFAIDVYKRQAVKLAAGCVSFLSK